MYDDLKTIIFFNFKPVIGISFRLMYKTEKPRKLKLYAALKQLSFEQLNIPKGIFCFYTGLWRNHHSMSDKCNKIVVVKKERVTSHSVSVVFILKCVDRYFYRLTSSIKTDILYRQFLQLMFIGNIIYVFVIMRCNVHNLSLLLRIRFRQLNNIYFS